MTMDISSVENVSGFQAAITQQKIDIAVFKKTLDASKPQSEATLEMLQSAAEITNQAESNTQLDLTI
jgi:Putative motility protein